MQSTRQVLLILALTVSFSIMAMSYHMAMARPMGEDAWEPVQIFTENFSLLGDGFVTPDGELRVRSINPSVHLKANLITKRTSTRHLHVFKNSCRRLEHGFYTIGEDNNAYKIKLKIPGLSPDELYNSVAINGRGERIPFQRVRQDIQYTVRSFKMSFLNGSNTLRFSRHETRDIEKRIKDQVSSQLQDESGANAKDIILDLSTLDEVVCDWVLGLAQFGFETQISFSAAKLNRKVTVSESQIRRIMADMEHRFSPRPSKVESAVLSSAHLSFALQAEAKTNISTLGENRFLHLWSGLYDFEKSEVRKMKEEGILQLSRSLDILSPSTVNQTAHFMTIFSEVIE